jgi:hypothetical protein
MAEQHEGAEVTEDVKAKFREALEKKHAHGGKDVSDHSVHGKVGGPRDPKTSGAQQMFRRKSGA